MTGQKNILLVLMVEDNPADARLIQEMFSETQMENSMLPLIVVECQTTLASAMTVLEQKNFDVVLLDLKLPDSAGLDTFRRIHTQFPQLPLIILSGTDDEFLALEAVREGAQDFLVKGRTESNLLTMDIRNAVERKRLEEENKSILAQLFQSQKLEAIGVLATGVAHDFNNLITAIRGSADMALFKCEANHPAVKDIKNVQAASERAGLLTRQLLLLSQKHHKEFTLFNINDVIESLIRMLHRILGEDIAIQTVLGNELWSVRADRGSMEQALLNLTVRSREAMLSGGTLSIKTENANVDDAACQNVQGARVGKFVRLTVSDTGVPIDTATLEHLFEPFQTGKGGEIRGMGLGLSVVQGIVKEHEGWIMVRSSEKNGTVFELFIPAVVEKAKQLLDKKIPFELLKGKGEKILIVEDEEGIREFARRSLSEMGYTVSVSATAFEALSIFRAESPKFDLAMIDVVLPDRSGIDLAGELFQLNPKTRILLNSGYMDHKSQWPLIEEKGWPFMQKPYSLAELLKKLRDVLSR